MAYAFSGIVSPNPHQVSEFRQRLATTMASASEHEIQVGTHQCLLLFSGDPGDVALTEERCLFLDRPPSGGGIGTALERRSPSAAELLSIATVQLTRLLHNPVSFVAVERDGSVALFRGLYSGRPLFYAVVDDAVCFASEIQLLNRFVNSSSANPDAIAEYLLVRWSSGRQSFVDGIRRVMPGQLVRLNENGSVECSFVGLPQFAERSTPWTLDEAVDATEAALRAEMRVLASRHHTAVVTLSAGVDSSLLLAIARQEFADVVAVTADWEGHGNRELDAARQIAAGLGVRHIAATMADAEIPELWRTVVNRLEAGPRRLSALPLLSCYRRAAQEGSVLIYGEAADTLFGSGQVRWLSLALRRRARLMARPRWQREIIRAGARLIGRTPGTQVPRLLDNTDAQLWAADVAIEYRIRPQDYFPLHPDRPELPPGFEPLTSNHRKLPAENRIQHLHLQISVVDHLMMASRLSEHAGIELVNLFTTPSVLPIFESLPVSLLSRGTETKPILRELAARYVDRRVIEAPKIGFPTPNRHWLEGPLSGEVEAVRKLAAAGDAGWWVTRRMADLSVADDVEAWWTAVGLASTFDQLGIDRLGGG
jgi:asparagine synthetase B (glutamine-hydrolysing)